MKSHLLKSLILLFLIGANIGCREVIVHELSELKANDVRLALAKSGIKAEKSREGKTWSIAVSEAEVTQALSILQAGRVISSEDLESIADDGGMLKSREERLFLLERKVAHQLEHTLESFPGVLEARVHIFTDSRSRFEVPKSSSFKSASVLILQQEQSSIGEEEVKQLIAGASGVKVDKISVVIGRDPELRTTLSKDVPLQKLSYSKAQLIEWFLIAGIVVCIFLLVFFSGRKQRRKINAGVRLSPPSSEPGVNTQAPYTNGHAPDTKEVF